MALTRFISHLSKRTTHYCRRVHPVIQRWHDNRCQNDPTNYYKVTTRSFFSTTSSCQNEALAVGPHVEDTTKEYSPKIQKLVDEIGALTLLEVSDLNELLKKTLNIKDTPMMSAMPVAAAAPSSTEDTEEAPLKQEQTIFSVKLVSFDAAKKIPVIKEIKNLMSGFNLVQAKKFVEAAPQTIESDIPKEEAEKIKAALEAVGAQVEIE
ncbi:39S ribosomal protein L12, mitochondrial [Octopus bimaculoides]|uniref:Large ribosomal subunit protein bL12m n=1 Tax=Octopus bimaculoides TaxID=37653 RepID=A0A0L8GQP3_OCTBM|nr:39S ribosomal protein L12, mitochondrial [Octopus bimaculoides]|eukprot:XP_014778913.1 PREDICTED: 39S ribosomal protein L12, mitochondrial-like [Octopus bimaculoides]